MPQAGSSTLSLVITNSVAIKTIAHKPELNLKIIHIILYQPYFLYIFSEKILDNQIETGLLKPEMKEKITYTLLRKHRHQTKKSNLRSLADIGKTVSSASRMFTSPDNGNVEASLCSCLSIIFFKDIDDIIYDIDESTFS